jgi:hypothetical protein
LFCYANYSHSFEFQQTKLGSWFSFIVFCAILCWVCPPCQAPPCRCSVCFLGLPKRFCLRERLVWHRHVRLPRPLHHVFRAKCMQLRPFVEMYCKWELEEECSNLQALMLRVDSEQELELHELGRSLLLQGQVRKEA